MKMRLRFRRTHRHGALHLCLALGGKGANRIAYSIRKVSETCGAATKRNASRPGTMSADAGNVTATSLTVSDACTSARPATVESTASLSTLIGRRSRRSLRKMPHWASWLCTETLQSVSLYYVSLFSIVFVHASLFS